MEPKSGIVNIDSKLHINEIDFFFTPRKKIFQEIYIPQGEPEMTTLESGFLCGCLKKYKPQKILEIGIAAGATTAIILECMESLGLDYEMHSIDYLEYFYRDKQKKSGYLAEDLIKRKQLENKHKFHLGDIAYNFLPEIGNEVDFVILDTMHILPGEVLDLICILPYLKDGAVVVLHDTSLNLYTDNRYCYANSTVFSSIVADKYINYDTDKSENAYPNIGAFIVDKETKNNVNNLFLSLFISWKYYPDENQIKSYKKAIDNLYGNTGRYLFEQALKLNKIHL